MRDHEVMSAASTSTTTSAAPPLAAATRVGTVDLTVTDLDRSIAFYGDVLGLQLRERSGDRAALGAGGDDLIVLLERPAAGRSGRHAGIYHAALLYPSRLELARVLQRLALSRTPIEGASDHGMSWAIYLPDPDGNGVELAADQPRSAWPDMADMRAIAPRPLDLQALLDLVGDEPAHPTADPGTTVGHVHLHVADIDAGLAFYRDLLGLEVQMRIPHAVFVSAGGYHHHVGFNTWRGAGVPVAPDPDAVVGLRHWTLLVTPADRAAILARATAAGMTVEERSDGSLLTDGAGMAVLVAPLDARRSPAGAAS